VSARCPGRFSAHECLAAAGMHSDAAASLSCAGGWAGCACILLPMLSAYLRNEGAGCVWCTLRGSWQAVLLLLQLLVHCCYSCAWLKIKAGSGGLLLGAQAHDSCRVESGVLLRLLTPGAGSCSLVNASTGSGPAYNGRCCSSLHPAAVSSCSCHARASKLLFVNWFVSS
jgi:hypothetical protein